MAVDVRSAPFRNAHWVDQIVDCEEQADGSFILRSPHSTGEASNNLIEPLRKWASECPDRTWLAERDSDTTWRRLSYAVANQSVSAIAAALLRRGIGHEDPDKAPVMIMSGNSLDHALMTYGAILAGAPAAPVSKSYSLLSSDFAKLKYVAELLEPKIIFVQNGLQFENALSHLDLDGVEVICVEDPPAAIPVTMFSDLLSVVPGAAVEAAYNALTLDTTAKLMFTSGSTGMPKAVINTHRMMCTNASGLLQTREEPERVPPVLLNWLPWNHCFGGNSILHGALNSGGTLYLDDGSPQPGQFARTVRNLKEIATTTYSNVPMGLAMLIEHLEDDAELRRIFFSRIEFMAYGGAVLSQDMFERLQKVAVEETGERICVTSGYGATETAPTLMRVYWNTETMGYLGLPVPGGEVKLAPVGDKYEVRGRGDFITPGYYKRPDLTEAAFDEDGFYKLGDAARFVDPDDPSKGLVFNGRVVEDFKLSTGTWVSAGQLRLKALAAADGLLRDCLVAGLDQNFVSLLGWPNEEACRKITGQSDMSVEEMVESPEIQGLLRERLAAFNVENPGSSTRVARAILMVEPPNMDAGEITDKGYINQALSLSRRDDLVQKIYTDQPGNDVIVIRKT